MNGNIGNTGDMGEMLSKMFEDPEALGKVMNIANALSASGALNGLSLGGERDNALKNEEKSHDSAGEVSPAHKAEPHMSGHEDEHEKKEIPTRPKIRQCDRIKLLEAMRPFLGEDKRDKLDVVIKLLGLAEAAGGLYSFKR